LEHGRHVTPDRLEYFAGEFEMKNRLSVATLAILAGAAAATSAHAQIAIRASNVAFVDIGASGASVGAISDDSENVISGAQLAAAGFVGNQLLFGGMSVRVGNNGGVVWGNSPADTFTNATEVGWANANANNVGATSIAAMTASNTSTAGNGNAVRQFIAPLWDDNFPGTGASTRWQVISGDLYIQWTNQDHFNAQGTGTITYQMVVRGGVTIASGLSLVDFVYQDTSYAANQYQNDGGSATIGYKNWGLNPLANDVEYGISGGSGSSTTDPAFGDPTMQPKVGGWVEAGNSQLTHSVSIVPAPGAVALLGLGGLFAGRRRR
jgi:MYXO-CTERM domain-containing protein